MPAFEAPALSAVYLHPGHLVASADPCVVTTILGSCVAVCVYDEMRGIGGVNHYLLPRATGSKPSARFGDVATRELIDRVLACGTRRANLRAKLFGGACTIEALQHHVNNIGNQNAEIALDVLHTERIPIVERDLGGARGRKLVFRTHDGFATVDRL